VLGQDAVLDTDNISGDPIDRLPKSRKATMLQSPTQLCLEASFCLAPLQQVESSCALQCAPQIPLSSHSPRLVHPINENEVAAERFVVHLEGECVLGRAIPGTSLFQVWKLNDHNHLGVPRSFEYLHFSQARKISAAVGVNRVRRPRSIDLEGCAIPNRYV